MTYINRHKLITIVILITVLIYKVSLTFLFNIERGKLFLHIINPITWLVISATVYILMYDKVQKRYKYEKEIKEWLFISALLYVVIYFSIGIFSGFGFNPYNRSLRGILLNVWGLGSIIVMKEFVRYVIINFNWKKDRLIINVCLITTFVLIDINLLNYASYFNNAFAILKFSAATLAPIIIENILLTYTATKGGLKPNILYKLVINIPLWTIPILPDCNWFVLSLLYCIIPFLTYMIINYYILKRENNIPTRLTEGISPKSLIFNFIVVIIAIVFVLGGTVYVPTSIVSNSMYPKIKIGDVVITEKMTIDKIKVGDIVHIKRNGYYVIHRVIKKNTYRGQIILITKGDNNKTKDYYPVSKEQVIGKIVVILPKIGYPSYLINRFIRTLKDGSNV